MGKFHSQFCILLPSNNGAELAKIADLQKDLKLDIENQFEIINV